MSHRRKISIKKLLFAALIGLLLLPLLFYGIPHILRPPQTDLERLLFQGVVYQRDARATPRPIMLHVVTIDLTAPGVKALVKPGIPTREDLKVPAQTTSEFLKEFKLQLAVNANFFFTQYENSPWDYYPHSGDMVNVVGQVISNGAAYSKFDLDWPVLCFSAQGRAQILENQKCPEGTTQAVAGKPLLVFRKKPVPIKDAPDNDGLYPRTAVGIDEQGVTLAELTGILMELGVYTALNLDGGGSTTLVVANGSKPSLLNSPIHGKIPMRQRPVANNLGFYAQPKDE